MKVREYEERSWAHATNVFHDGGETSDKTVS